MREVSHAAEVEELRAAAKRLWAALADVCEAAETPMPNQARRVSDAIWKARPTLFETRELGE
jgi:hypothetical protein